MTDTSDETERLAAAEPTPAFERTISPISGRLSAGRNGKALVLAGLVAGCGLFVAASWRDEDAKAEPATNEPARQVVPFEPIRADASPTLAAPGDGAPQLSPATTAGPTVPALQSTSTPDAQAGVNQREAEVLAVRGEPLLAYRRSGGGVEFMPSAGVADMVPGIQVAAAEGTSELDQLRRGSTIGQARATIAKLRTSAV